MVEAGTGFFLKTFHIIRQDREDGYGGVATLIKDYVLFDLIKKYNNGQVQYITIKIKNVYLTNIYSCNNNAITNELLEEILNLGTPMILVGDLNCHHPMWDEVTPNKGGKTLHDFAFKNELIILNDGAPTLFQNPHHVKSAVDLSIVSSELAIHAEWSTISECGTSDHFPTSLKIGNDTNSIFFDGCRLTPYKSRNFHRADWKKYYELLTLKNFSGNVIDIDEFQNIINQVASQCIPLKTVNEKSNVHNPGGTQSVRN